VQFQTRLVFNDKTWEGNVVEVPDMFKHNGKYYLFFSANNYAGVDYAVGYASCQTARGQCQQAPENPILACQVKQPPFVIGPGGETVFQVGNQAWVVYHAWNVNPDGSRGPTVAPSRMTSPTCKDQQLFPSRSQRGLNVT
jgi:glycosyl hydrolase family 43